MLPACLKIILKFLPGSYLGWSLGSNHAANVFGPQVNSGTIKYRNAIILAAAFIVVGAVLEGRKCFSIIGGISDLVLVTAIISTLAAGLTVNLMSYLGLPVSTTQAIVGSIIGLSLLKGNPIDYTTVTKIFICWILTPVGAIIIAFISYNLLALIWQKRTRNLVTFSLMVRVLSILIGCYAAYSLGANNVANVMGTFVGANALAPFSATILGGISISAGVLTYSRNVMYTVGKKITPLDPFSALIAVLAEAITLHLFAQIGVPVSSSQAVVGAVVGVGLVKGTRMINRITLIIILAGWILTLLSSAAAAYALGWMTGTLLQA
jgi:PiT family inorganic phosphate transporter